MKIDDIIIGKRFRKDLGNINSLAASIEELQLLQPVVVRPDNTLVAGARRIAACKKIGWQDIPARIVKNLDEELMALKAERDENTCRLALAPSEAVAIGGSIEARERAEAKGRQQEHGGTAPGRKSLPENFRKCSGDSRDAVGEAVGMSGKTYEKAKAVIEAAKQNSDLRPIAEKMDKERNVDRAYKEVMRKEKIKKAEAEIKTKPEPLPTGPFEVIAIDPPWKYDGRRDDNTHRGRTQYPDMSMDDIKALPVKKLADKNCVLWLWTTNSFMPEAHTCLEVWGFEPKTILTWNKVNIGLGDYLRNVTEHCILATRGKPVFKLTNQTTLITEKRREHSRKPEIFYSLVESLCIGSRLEMFSRQPRVGWQSWGAEKNEF